MMAVNIITHIADNTPTFDLEYLCLQGSYFSQVFKLFIAYI